MWNVVWSLFLVDRLRLVSSKMQCRPFICPMLLLNGCIMGPIVPMSFCGQMLPRRLEMFHAQHHSHQSRHSHKSRQSSQDSIEVGNNHYGFTTPAFDVLFQTLKGTLPIMQFPLQRLPISIVSFWSTDELLVVTNVFYLIPALQVLCIFDGCLFKQTLFAGVYFATAIMSTMYHQQLTNKRHLWADRHLCDRLFRNQRIYMVPCRL
jgi:hypothetical protein